MVSLGLETPVTARLILKAADIMLQQPFMFNIILLFPIVSGLKRKKVLRSFAFEITGDK